MGKQRSIVGVHKKNPKATKSALASTMQDAPILLTSSERCCWLLPPMNAGQANFRGSLTGIAGHLGREVAIGHAFLNPPNLSHEC